MIRVALIGNPNCGKTTLFNALTGTHQRVGNWPGVTVEKKTGRYRSESIDVALTDLPGVYSLLAADGPEAIDQRVAGLRVLVADDEPDAREVMRAALESHGGQVVCVASAAEALTAVTSETFDALVLDIGMPG